MIANGATVLPKHKSGEPPVRESHRKKADSQAEREERRAGSDGRKLACGLEVGRGKEVDDFHHNDGVEERGRVSEQSRAAPENVERNCRVSNERTLDEEEGDDAGDAEDERREYPARAPGVRAAAPRESQYEGGDCRDEDNIAIRVDAESARIPQTLKDIGGDALEVHLLELFASGRLRRLDVEEEDDEQDGDAAERQVEVKEPAPLAGGSEGAADRRADGRSERPNATDDSEIGAPLGERDEVADDDFDHGEDRTSANALD